MDYIFLEHPGEMVRFFKRVMKFAMWTGCFIILLLLHVLFAPSSSLLPSNWYDIGLKFSVGTRVVIFFAQLPVRWKLACMIWKLDGMARYHQTQRLFEII